MNWELETFIGSSLYPKFLLLSEHHRCLGLGQSPTKGPLTVHAEPFYGHFFAPEWAPFAPYASYTPLKAFLDGREITRPRQDEAKTPPRARLHPDAAWNHHLNAPSWTSLAEEARLSDIEKIVLGRATSLPLEQGGLPTDALRALVESEGSFFAFAPEEDVIFFGVTPEHLFTRGHDFLMTEAVAGTRKRGRSPSEDQSLQHELLTSSKDQKEIAFVFEDLQKKLTPLSKDLSFTPVGIKKSPHVQHLHRRFEATLKSPGNDRALIQALHPTPAMCGTPQKPARDWLRTYEGFDRGLYASPLGWSTDNLAEVVIGIRSCLMSRKCAKLYAAAGIVEASNPEDEWKELDHKLQLMTQALSHEHRQTQPNMQ